jgi:colanic acid biosynthesis protein WcaH
MLSHDKFLHVVENAPLFSIDLVVMNEHQEVLLGLRKNPPAKGFWFVPGGRLFKDESLDIGFGRITQSELNHKIERASCQLLGLFEHFYDDSIFGPTVSTHYINAAHFVLLPKGKTNLPESQHEQYRWVSIEALQKDPAIHPYSKVFLPALVKALSLQSV